MLKGLHLTDRDFGLFEYLASGPAFEDDLHARFFNAEGRLVHRSIILRRMRKLRKEGLIGRLNPRRISGKGIGHKAIYVLDKAGIELLSREGVMPSERIRQVRLDVRSIFHEILLTRLIRKIYEGEASRYQVERLYDHLDLAKMAHRKRLKRIPDLRFTVKLRSGEYFSFIVEVDAGTTHMPEMVQKLAVFPKINKALSPIGATGRFGILIVCHTESWMARIQRAVRESRVTAPLLPNFLFNAISNVDNSLGLHNPWFRADGKKVESIFKRG